ncbi:F-box only protein 31-like [Daphnia pulicaria]|uniref:F-box only protein 31-like n=1 Tax=Daphnia pulicaria TaxID=35523 RepID=UPI001EEA4987|nr:F-box only protein 31-like [Daphnia pulicaria]
MELFSLPHEVLEAIISLLTPLDIISLSSTCKFFHELMLSDKVWVTSCYTKFGIKLRASGGFAQKFYKKVLHKYGKFLGLWNRHADCYGGLLHIKYLDEKLCAFDLQLPKDPHISNPLRPKIVFSIELDELDNLSITCCINPLKKHQCALHYGKKALTPSSPQSFYLTRQCANGIENADHQDILDDLENWLDEQSDYLGEHSAYTRTQMIYKYMVLRQTALKTHYSKLVLPQQCDFRVPIKPGLFKGTYSSHGLELIMLTYEEVNKVNAVKISGDQNIPAGQITFRADLPFCMHLSQREQESFENIESVQPASSEVEWHELPTPQPFVVPYDCVERHDQVPDSCKARFHGFGQIAEEGFREPTFVEGHWIVFNENLFGFLWISLQSLSMYHRVQEELTN